MLIDSGGMLRGYWGNVPDRVRVVQGHQGRRPVLGCHEGNVPVGVVRVSRVRVCTCVCTCRGHPPRPAALPPASGPLSHLIMWGCLLLCLSVYGRVRVSVRMCVSECVCAHDRAPARVVRRRLAEKEMPPGLCPSGMV